jgi:hypothetical protein
MGTRHLYWILTGPSFAVQITPGNKQVCDAGDEKESPVGEMNQLLQFGAACNVFYLFSLDTDQLTGPQVMIG